MTTMHSFLFLLLVAVLGVLAGGLLLAAALASGTLAKGLMGLLRQLYGEEETRVQPVGRDNATSARNSPSASSGTSIPEEAA